MLRALEAMRSATTDPLTGLGNRRRFEQRLEGELRRGRRLSVCLLDLDGLASPFDALDLFDPAWYGADEPVAPAGLLASRGCPATCTFCSNNVTGRRYRYRPESDDRRAGPGLGR